MRLSATSMAGGERVLAEIKKEGRGQRRKTKTCRLFGGRLAASRRGRGPAACAPEWQARALKQGRCWAADHTEFRGSGSFKRRRWPLARSLARAGARARAQPAGGACGGQASRHSSRWRRRRGGEGRHNCRRACRRCRRSSHAGGRAAHRHAGRRRGGGRRQPAAGAAAAAAAGAHGGASRSLPRQQAPLQQVERAHLHRSPHLVRLLPAQRAGGQGFLSAAAWRGCAGAAPGAGVARVWPGRQRRSSGQSLLPRGSAAAPP